MRARITILFLLCVIAASVLSGCITTQLGTQNNTSSMTSASRNASSNSSLANVLAPPQAYRVTIGNVTVDAEAANTPAQWEAGLMNRTSLSENAGMLFVFPLEEQQSFWMKNMRFPLDIVFITADKHVLEIYQSVPPCTSDPCAEYNSSAPIKYALEVNSGFTERYGIKSGDPVLIVPAS